jgi:hypothetical protein
MSMRSREKFVCRRGDTAKKFCSGNYGRRRDPAGSGDEAHERPDHFQAAVFVGDGDALPTSTDCGHANVSAAMIAAISSSFGAGVMSLKPNGTASAFIAFIASPPVFQVRNQDVAKDTCTY